MKQGRGLKNGRETVLCQRINFTSIVRRIKMKDIETNIQAKKLLSVKDVAEMLGLRPQTIYNRLSLNLFPIRHKKLGRLVRFEAEEVERFLKNLPGQW